MSLDVCLLGPEQEIECECECGHRHSKAHQECFYSANITHNLSRMAAAAGIYYALWRPGEVGITKASDLIEPLEKGLTLLNADPYLFEALNAANGWGTYKHFVPWVEEYLDACKKYPDALVEASR